MIFFAVLMLFMIAVIFFHYVQGFFSAALSAIFTVIAAVFAFSYHETIVENYLGGRIADYAHGIVLLGLFAVIYLALRIMFDNLVPGNVRVPTGVDKVGALVMGLIAGLFVTGILAIAAEEFPYPGSIAGYSRFATNDDRQVTVPTRGQGKDTEEWAELSTTTPGDFGVPNHLILPVDDIVVDTVEKLSGDGGSLSDGKPLVSIHPQFLDELFGERAGVETGANHVAMNLVRTPPLEAVKVVGLYRLPPNVQQVDSDVKEVRTGGPLKPVQPKSGEMFLVVRVMFTPQAEDHDGFVRFSPGDARLVAPIRTPSSSEPVWTDYWPVGTLDDANKLYLNKPDDYLFVEKHGRDKGADFVYRVNARAFGERAPADSFFEFKRLGRVSLSGQPVKNRILPDPNIDVLRKVTVTKKEESGTEAAPPPTRPEQATPAPTPAPAPAANTNEFAVQTAEVADSIPVPITVAAGSENKPFEQVPGGTGGFKDGKATSLDIDSTRAEQNLAKSITQFSVPDGQVMVKVSGAPGSAAQWAPALEPEQYELVDSASHKFQPHGVFILYTAKGAERMHMRYQAATTISGFSQPDNAQAVKQVTFMYLVPTGTAITEFDDHGKRVGNVSVTAK